MTDMTRESILVRRDQFDISPQGIVHKPTDAGFTPHPGDPHSVRFRSGKLGNGQPGPSFDPDHVERIMRELWAEYVTENRDLFIGK